MEKTQVLRQLGLSDKEARTYLAILELGGTTIKPIAEKAEVKRTSVYNFIEHLVQLGLITQTKVRNRMHYSAASPAKLVQMQKENLVSLESALPEFLAAFSSPSKKARVQYFEGPEQMKNIIWEEARCINETRYIWTGKDILEMIGGPKFMMEVDRQRIKNGIIIKTIRFREKEAPYPFSSAGTKHLRELRYAPKGVNIPMTMGIYDTSKVGFFSTKQEGFGILIESREFQETMAVFHQLLWEKSKPGKVGEG